MAAPQVNQRASNNPLPAAAIVESESIAAMAIDIYSTNPMLPPYPKDKHSSTGRLQYIESLPITPDKYTPDMTSPNPQQI